MVEQLDPGPYFEEVPGNIHQITGVPTSITAFIGRAAAGPFDTAVKCLGFADFTRAFRGGHPENQLARCIRLFFENGGTVCYVVRIRNRKNRTLTPDDYAGDKKARTGFHALDSVDIFNLMVIPGDSGIDEAGQLRI